MEFELNHEHHNETFFNITADGTHLSVFASGLEAVECAIEHSIGIADGKPCTTENRGCI